MLDVPDVYEQVNEHVYEQVRHERKRNGIPGRDDCVQSNTGTRSMILAFPNVPIPDEQVTGRLVFSHLLIFPSLLDWPSVSPVSQRSAVCLTCQDGGFCVPMM